MKSSWLRFLPLLPLLGAALNGLLPLFGKRLTRQQIQAVACAFPLAAFVLSLYLFSVLTGLKADQRFLQDTVYTWMSVGSLKVNFGFRLDALSSVLLLIITGVGSLIHIFSIGYMEEEEDKGYGRYFAYLNFFLFAMLLLVLGDSLLVMFVGWEGVGLASYLLIGFWFTDPNKAKAGMKAFVVNRVGDLGFLLGIFALFWSLAAVLQPGDAFTFQTLQLHAAKLAKLKLLGLPAVEVICLLLFVGAVGKSAQIPLYIWLPDAMAGPTPVSALIHAATMVTAGVYMIARLHFLYANAVWASLLVATVGACTALFAATIGLFQNDIKKVLAYSTVSQLGFMFIGVGVGAYAAGVFHLMTHAFFKALLFLAAGSVIVGMHHEQDIRKMGGLFKHMSLTGFTFGIGTLAIIGFPGFSGFFSKDEILWEALKFKHAKLGAFPGILLWLLGTAAAILTAFYMVRLFSLTFLGEFRADRELRSHLHEGLPHESPLTMTGPLLVLAILSAVGGLVGIPHVLGGTNKLHGWLSSVFGAGSHHAMKTQAFAGKVTAAAKSSAIIPELGAMAIAVAAMLVGSIAALYLYARNARKAIAQESALAEDNAGGRLGFIYRLLLNKYHVDELNDEYVIEPTLRFSEKGLWFFDTQIIDGLVHLVGRVAKVASQFLRWLQSGNVKLYIYGMIVGVVTFLMFLMLSSSL